MWTGYWFEHAILKKCLLVLILTYNVKKVILLENSRKTDRIARKPYQGKGFPAVFLQISENRQNWRETLTGKGFRCSFPAHQGKPTELQGNPIREEVMEVFYKTRHHFCNSRYFFYNSRHDFYNSRHVFTIPDRFLQFPTGFFTIPETCREL